MRVIILWLVYFATCKGQIVTFSLADFNPLNHNTTVQKRFINLTTGLSEISVTDVPETVGFFILQVHSYPYNVTLSYKKKMKDRSSVRARNVGLVSFDKPETVFYVRAENSSQSLIVVTIYTASDPIPGGCNLSFDTEYAPYQIVSYTEDVIIVQSQAPSAPDTTCDKDNVQVDMYHLYLPENNFNSFYYFDQIHNMLTVENIKKFGHRVPTVDGHLKYNKLYSAYRGVGQVFAIVATYNNRTSAYVPAVSYGCDITNQVETCNGPVTSHWKLICALLLIFGLFVNFFGHKFFRFTLYLTGFIIGIFITYVVLSAISSNNLSISETTTTSIILGLVFGSLWLFLWWKFGIPIFSASMTFFLSGFLVASIIFYAGVADLGIFRNDANFWLTFACIIVAFQTIWTMWTLEGHIFGCSFIGAYACVAALNYYIGGNLQYIVINSFRRMAVKDFNEATIAPPFQLLDLAQSALLLVMTTFGFYHQLKAQRGKPPFPPHRYNPVREGVTETTPLLTSSGVVFSDI